MAYTAGTSSTNKSVAIGFVIAFHILVVWGLASGLAHNAAELIRGPIETKIIEEVKVDKDTPPPPPPKQLDIKMPELPPALEIDVAVDIVAPTTTAITTTAKPTPVAPQPTPKVAALPFTKKPNAGKIISQVMMDAYPEASIRAEEEGSVKMVFCLASNGRVDTANTKIAESSGFRRLDDAAMKAALAGKFDRAFVVGRDAEGNGTGGCLTVPFKFVLPQE